MPTAGEACVKCGQVVRSVNLPTPDLGSAFVSTTPTLRCGCRDLEGPRTASDAED